MVYLQLTETDDGEIILEVSRAKENGEMPTVETRRILELPADIRLSSKVEVDNDRGMKLVESDIDYEIREFNE